MCTCRLREEAEERKEFERKKTAIAAKAVFKAQLAEQIADRKAAKDGRKAEVVCEELALQSMHQVLFLIA